MQIMNVGQEVTGIYLGVSYAGKVTYRRPHTMNDSIIYMVDLTQPMTFMDDFRDVGYTLAVTVGGPRNNNTIEAA